MKPPVGYASSSPSCANRSRVGTDIAVNVHYTPNGKPLTDHVRIGFTLAKEPPKRHFGPVHAHARDESVDVIDGEHHATEAQRVDRLNALPVGSPHHGKSGPDIGQEGGTKRGD
jgi:hypothetical protein